MINKYYSFSIARGYLLILLLFFVPSNAFPLNYKGLDLKIKTTVAEMYDDNITFSKDDKEEDYITTLGLHLSTLYEGKKRMLSISGRADQRFNARFSDIKNSSESTSLNFRNYFTEYDRINLEYLFSHTYTPESFEEALDRVVARQEFFDHRVKFNYVRILSESFNVNLRYAYRLRKFSDELRPDQYNHRIGFTLNYKPSIEHTYFLTYAYSQNKFNDVFNTIRAGTKRYLTKSLYIDGQLGVDFTSSTQSFTLTDNDRSTLSAEVSLTDQIDEITSAQISYIQGQQFSSEDGNIANSWQINGQFSRQLLNRLNSTASIFYGINQFDDTEVKNTFLGGSFSLSYEFLDDLYGSLNYVYANFNSNEETVGYTRNTIQLALNKTF